uniref:DH domain-containing protein n=1 Tax=Panagrolaimus superbus TaxID=310955 RepID=A0A914YHR4_9BILA
MSLKLRLQLGKPRSLSTCPVNVLFAEDSSQSLSAATTPIHSNNPLGELVAAYPPRRGSHSIESCPDSVEHHGSMIFNEEHLSGTISARGKTSRKGIFSARDNKLTSAADRTLTIIVGARCTDLSILEIENHWTEIVKKHTQFPESTQKQQAAIWEIIETEKRYIKSLQNMDDLTNVLFELQRQGYLLDIKPAKVFLNYGDLLRNNLEFWERGLLPMILESRESGAPLSPSLMYNGFAQILQWSKFYITFNVGHADSLNYVRKTQKDNEKFGEFVQWCESLNMMNRQTLIDNLSIPMQRLTRYPLMLKNVLKATTDSNEKNNIQEMIDLAELATRQLNYEMNNKDLQIQLIEIMKTIESYDVIDTKEFDELLNLKNSYHHFNLLNPMPYVGTHAYRRIITKGDLKMREPPRQAAKSDVHCILFTDMFLICKSSKKDNTRLKVIKSPLHISTLICIRDPNGLGFNLISINDFGYPIFFKTMLTANFEETRRWMEMIQMAQEEFRRIHTHDIEFVLNEREKNRAQFKENIRSQTPTSAAATSWINEKQPGIAHKKSHSMDSQVVAASRPSSAHLRKSETLNSAEQLDRRHFNDTPGSSGSKASLASSYAEEQSPSLTASASARNNSPARAAQIPSVISMNGHTPNSFESDSVHSSMTPPLAEESSEEAAEAACISPQGNHAIFEDVGSCSSPIDFGTSGDSLTSQNLRQLALNNGRRFEKRYHTVGEIDSQRPVHANGPTAILKRFSWNVSSAMSGSSRKISSKLNELNGRRYSQSTVGSSDSFGSSTSGISSASSQDTGTIVSTTMTDTSTLTNIAAEIADPHISTVLIGGDQLSPRPKNSSPTTEKVSSVSINLEKHSPLPDSKLPSSLSPIPDVPPPESCSGSDDTLTLQKTSSELLKFILDDNIETSDI